jgi:UDP-N-acetylglucosamine transferase subunit ALG13
MTFVTVGNATQPFRRLLEAVERLARDGALPQPIVVQSGHTTGFRSRICDVRPFLKMEDFEAYVARAAVVIGHAGAGTIVHALARGRRPVVMPRRAQHGEHVDDHQAEFARRLAETGRIFVAWEAVDLSKAVEAALRQADGARLTESGLVGVVRRQIEELIGAP